MATAHEAARRDDWDRHWKDYAEAAEHNPAQQFRRRLVFGELGLADQPACLLDIGSGQGDFASDVLHRLPHTALLGLEASASGIEMAERKAPAATFLQRDLLESTEVDSKHRGWATHAVCSEVLEHVDEPVKLLANAAAYMQPGCRLVVTVPGGRMSAFDRHIGHRRHFTPADLRSVLEAAGFEVEATSGRGFPVFNLYRLVVIMRGRRLVDDVSGGGSGTETRPAAAAMAVFSALFRINPPFRHWGWQTVGSARFPAQGANADS